MRSFGLKVFLIASFILGTNGLLIACHGEGCEDKCLKGCTGRCKLTFFAQYSPCSYGCIVDGVYSFRTESDFRWCGPHKVCYQGNCLSLLNSKNCQKWYGKHFMGIEDANNPCQYRCVPTDKMRCRMYSENRIDGLPCLTTMTSISGLCHSGLCFPKLPMYNKKGIGLLYKDGGLNKRRNKMKFPADLRKFISFPELVARAHGINIFSAPDYTLNHNKFRPHILHPRTSFVPQPKYKFIRRDGRLSSNKKSRMTKTIHLGNVNNGLTDMTSDRTDLEDIFFEYIPRGKMKIISWPEASLITSSTNIKGDNNVHEVISEQSSHNDEELHGLDVGVIKDTASQKSVTDETIESSEHVSKEEEEEIKEEDSSKVLKHDILKDELTAEVENNSTLLSVLVLETNIEAPVTEDIPKFDSIDAIPDDEESVPETEAHLAITEVQTDTEESISTTITVTDDSVDASSTAEEHVESNLSTDIPTTIETKEKSEAVTSESVSEVKQSTSNPKESNDNADALTKAEGKSSIEVTVSVSKDVIAEDSTVSTSHSKS